MLKTYTISEASRFEAVCALKSMRTQVQEFIALDERLTREPASPYWVERLELLETALRELGAE